MSNNLILRLISSIIISPLVIFLIYSGKYYFYFLLIIISIISVYEMLKLKNKTIQFIIFFLIIMFNYSNFALVNFENGKYIIFYVILITWTSDIGGYIFGKFIGGKKISIISPNKTYSGFIGSLLSVQMVLYFLNFLNLNFLNDLLMNSFFILSCTLVVIFGDLIFSYFKRKCCIKDFSSLIPGHGGLLDRIDGLVFLTIFIYLFV